MVVPQNPLGCDAGKWRLDDPEQWDGEHCDRGHGSRGGGYGAVTVAHKHVGEWIPAREQHDITIRMLRGVGEFVPAGAPLLEGTARISPIPTRARAAVRLGNERSLDEDVGFGLRTRGLAERALSPGVNDPTTAVQVIDQLHDLLRASRPGRCGPDRQ